MSVADGPASHSLLRPLTNRELAHLLASSEPTCTRAPSVVLLRWCGVCVGWMRAGSAAAGRCIDCGTPRRP